MISQEPIFIVGSPRTGTTALVSGLLAAGISGHKEGHFLPLFDELRSCAAQWYQRHQRMARLRETLLSSQPYEGFIEQYKDFVSRYMHGVYGTNCWLEKTGSRRMLLALPFLREVFPKAKIVYCKRRPIEVLVSRLKKFPTLPFDAHCEDLAAHMEEWLDIRDSVSGWYELEQDEMLRTPEIAASNLGSFLVLSLEQRARLLEFISTRRPEKSSTDYELITLEHVEWTAEQKQLFSRRFAGIMKNYGYGEHSYYTHASPPQS